MPVNWRAVGGALLATVALLVVLLLALRLTNGAGRGWVAAGVVLVLGLVWAGWRVRRASRWVAVAVSTALAVLVCLPGVPTGRVLPPEPPGAVSDRWTLDTGSTVAVHRYPAPSGTRVSEVPILYLHGGPIRGVARIDHAFLAELAVSAGRDVYLYEQAGAGRSDLLALEEYSVERSTRDLLAVIDRMDRGPVDVIGFSAGGSLLAAALTDPGAPERVRRAVFVEPGPMDGPTAAEAGPAGSPNAGDLAGPLPGPRSTTTPRYAVAFGLQRLGWLSAENRMVGQAEALNAFTAADLGRDTARAYCARDADRIPEEDSARTFSFNPAASARVMEDIRDSPALDADLAQVRTPAMLMVAECSAQPLAWSVRLAERLPSLDRVQRMPGVGHRVWNGLDENNARAIAVIDAFLRGADPVLPDVTLPDVALP